MPRGETVAVLVGCIVSHQSSLPTFAQLDNTLPTHKFFGGAKIPIPPAHPSYPAQP